MTKLTLNDVANAPSQAAAVNANSDRIEQEFEKVLYRDGTGPNAMGADLDMNSHRITNLPAPVNNTEAARKVDVDTALANIKGDKGDQGIPGPTGPPGANGTGSGDMTKATYDTNNNGKVDVAEAADAVAWTGVSGKPTFATVATTGVYSDLTGKPTLGTAAAKAFGTTAGQLVEVQTGGKLPALDGSNLTSLPNSGKLIKAVSGTLSTYTSVTAQIPMDDTIPQVTEGTQIVSISVTTTSATQTVRVAAQLEAITSALSAGVVALFRDSNANAIAARAINFNGNYQAICLEYTDTPGVAGTYTYSLRIGPSTAVTMYVNGSTTARTLGGSQLASLHALVIEA